MSITGWACPNCKQNVPLDHFDETFCGAVVHPDYARAVSGMDDAHYISGVVEVTDGWSCPRSRAIEDDAKDVYVNPLAYNSLLIGRAWDGYIERHAPEELRKIHVVGELAGIEVHGEIDRLRWVKSKDGHTYLLVEDWKHGNNFAQKYAAKEGVKPEHILQASIYAELYAQMGNERPTHGAIWNHYSGAKPDPLLPFVFLLWDPLTCLNYKPFRGNFTVAELYHQSAEHHAAKVSWSSLPLVGETMSFGDKSYCDYCQVRSTCFTEAKGAPF
jgi:hypothetical protein